MPRPKSGIKWWLLTLAAGILPSLISGLVAGADPIGKFTGETLELPAQSVAPGKATLTISLEIAAGYQLNAEAPSTLTMVSQKKEILTLNREKGQTFSQPKFPLTIPIDVSPGQTRLQVDLVLYYCKTGQEGLCLFKEARLNLPVNVTADANNHQLQAPYRLLPES